MFRLQMLSWNNYKSSSGMKVSLRISLKNNKSFGLILVARNNTYFVLLGLGLGATGGCMIGLYFARKSIANPIMKSVACVSFLGGPDNVTLTKTNLPHLKSNADVLVRVRAASINRLDVEIAQG